MNKYFNEKILNDANITDQALAIYLRVTNTYHEGYIIHKNTFLSRSSFGREVFTRGWHALIDGGYILQTKSYTQGRITYTYDLPEVAQNVETAITEVAQAIERVVTDKGINNPGTRDTQITDIPEDGKRNTKNSILIDEHGDDRRKPDLPTSFIDMLVPSNIAKMECYHAEAIEAILKEELGENYTEAEAIKLLTVAVDKYVRHKKNVKRSHWCYFLRTVTQKASEWVKGKYHKERKEVTADKPEVPENRPQATRTTEKKTSNRFMNFDQREYDFDELEKMLLTRTVNA